MTRDNIESLTEIIEQLEDLREHCKSYIHESYVWKKDTIALTKAIEMLTRLGNEESC